MSEETTDKSIVVWHPHLVHTVPDPREWTSLFLFNDRVIIPMSKTLDESIKLFKTRQCLDTKKLIFDADTRIHFFKTLHTLEKVNIVQISLPYDFLNLLESKLITSNKPQLKEDMVKLLNDKEDLNASINQIVQKITAFQLVQKTIENKFFPKCMQELKAEMHKLGVLQQKTKVGIIELFQKEYILDNSFRQIFSYVLVREKGCPLVSNDLTIQHNINDAEFLKVISQILANSVISQLALPDVKAVHIDDLLEARTELQDELLEFRAGILKLTWLLHQQIRNKKDLNEIRQEANILTSTVIKGSLLSLENRMKIHKKKGIRRMLVGTGRILVEATKLFLPSGSAEKMISSGKSLLQLATEIDSVKPPEDQVATYLYKLRGKLRTGGNTEP